MAKLILLRGNSGSGKTTIAKQIQKRLGYGTMLISQDVIRREILYVKGKDDKKAEELLTEIIMYGKERCDILILEGILNKKKYENLLRRIKEEFKENVYAYYFDLPFEETLKRHKLRESANEFGEEEMLKWWKEKDFIQFIPEKRIGKELSIDAITEMIIKEVKG